MKSRYLMAERSVRPGHEVLESAWEKYEDDFQQRRPFDDGSRPGPALELLPYRIGRRLFPALKPPSYNAFLLDLALQLLLYVPPMALLAWAGAVLGVPTPGGPGTIVLGGVVIGAGIALVNRLYDIFVPLPSWREYLERAGR